MLHERMILALARRGALIRRRRRPSRRFVEAFSEVAFGCALLSFETTEPADGGAKVLCLYLFQSVESVDMNMNFGCRLGWLAQHKSSFFFFLQLK